MISGRCFGVGVGPGDPELMTVKAVRVIAECPTIAYFCAARRPSNARRVVQRHLRPDHAELRFVYPVTTEAVPPGTYATLLVDFYDQSAKRLAEVLDDGHHLAGASEGHPFSFFSSLYPPYPPPP